MATLWCPQCRSEYREGFTRCSDCGVALVEVLPPPADAHHHHAKPSGPFTSDDVTVELVNVSAVEAELIAARLRSAGIPVAVMAIGTTGELVALQFSEGSRVMVRRGDLDAARRAIAEIPYTGAAAAPDDATLAAEADAARGFTDPETGAVV